MFGFGFVETDFVDVVFEIFFGEGCEVFWVRVLLEELFDNRDDGCVFGTGT